MTTINKPGVTNPQAPVQLSSKGTTSGSAAAAPASTSVRPSDDSVKFSAQALELKSASETSSDGKIDQAKVDAIRLSLSNGTYKINAQAVADKALAMDNQLAGVGKA